MKKSSLKKQSKQKISVIQRKLWEECRRICGKIYANEDGTVDCYTCGAKNLQGSNRQLGHMLAKASVGAYLKYDLRVLRWQDYRCNINLGGQGAIFIERMRKEEGDEYVNQILKDRQMIVNAYSHYEMLLERYKLL